MSEHFFADTKQEILDRLDKNLPIEMKATPHWLLWKLKKGKTKDGKEKLDKVPLNVRTGRPHDPKDPCAWGSFDEAGQAFLNYKNARGIGFVLAGTEVCCIDLDHILKADGTIGAIPQLAGYNTILAVLDGIQGTYIERSQSGTGLHFFFKARQVTAKQKTHDGVEVYAGMVKDGATPPVRFIAMTGDTTSESRPALKDCQALVDQIYSQAMPADTGKTGQAGQRTKGTGVWAHASGPALTDQEVREKLLSEKEYAPKYMAILDGTWTRIFGDDASRARMSLANKLAYYCGGPNGRNMDQMMRLLEETPLLDHHDTRDAQRRATRDCITAIRSLTGVYDPKGFYQGSDDMPSQVQSTTNRKDAEKDPKNPYGLTWTPAHKLEKATRMPFPVDAFPDTSRQYIDKAGPVYQTIPMYVGEGLIGGDSVALLHRVVVEGDNGKLLPLNRYTIILDDSGNNKSGGCEVVQKVMQDYQTAIQIEKGPKVAERQLQRQVAQNDIKELQKALTGQAKELAKAAKLSEEEYNEKKEELRTQADRITKEIARIQKCLEPGGSLEELTCHLSYILDLSSATPEAAEQLAFMNGGQLGFISDEARTLLDDITGAYGGRVNLDFWLKAFDGKGSATYRIGRKSTNMANVDAAFLLYSQPDVIEDKLKNLPDGRKSPFAASGFMARAHTIKAQEEFIRPAGQYEPLEMDPAIDVVIKRSIWAMLSLEPRKNQNERIRLHMTTEARKIWIDYQDSFTANTRKYLDNGNDNPDRTLAPVDAFVKKIRGKVLVDAGLLAMRRYAEVYAANNPQFYGCVDFKWEPGQDLAIEDTDMQAAIKLMDYSLHHAKILHGMTGTGPDLVNANAVIRAIQKIEHEALTVNDWKPVLTRTEIQRKTGRGLRGQQNSEVLSAALNYLEYEGLIQTLESVHARGARPLSGPYAIHPDILTVDTN